MHGRPEKWTFFTTCYESNKTPGRRLDFSTRSYPPFPFSELTTWFSRILNRYIFQLEQLSIHKVKKMVNLLQKPQYLTKCTRQLLVSQYSILFVRGSYFNYTSVRIYLLLTFHISLSTFILISLFRRLTFEKSYHLYQAGGQ